MTGVIPNGANGAKVVRDGAGACLAPAGVFNAYCPPSTFKSTCELAALPNDCTAIITPEQINALVSEMLALAAKMDPSGTWNCASVTNLAVAFANWAARFGFTDEVTIGGDGTINDPFHIIPAGVVAAVCGDDAAADLLANCLISTDSGNAIVQGADGRLFGGGGGNSTCATIDGTGSPADPLCVNILAVINAICATQANKNALATCLVSSDDPNGLTIGSDGGLVSQKSDYYNAGAMTGTPNAWTGPATPTMEAGGPALNSILVAIVPADNTLSTVTITTDGVTHPAKLIDGTAPAAGDFKALHSIMWRFDGANWLAVRDLTTGTVPGATAAGNADGNVIYGIGVPTAAVGVDGDYYYAIDYNAWYGPKAGGWGSAPQIGSDYYNLNTTTGTSTAYQSAVPRPDIPNAGPNDNSIWTATIHATNTATNPTMTASGGTARGIRRSDGSNLLAGDLIAGHRVQGYYDKATNTYRAVMDLTTGKVIGGSAGGIKLLASGNTGLIAPGTVFETLTDLGEWQDLLIEYYLPGTGSPASRVSLSVQLSTDNGVTWQTSGYLTQNIYDKGLTTLDSAWDSHVGKFVLSGLATPIKQWSTNTNRGQSLTDFNGNSVVGWSQTLTPKNAIRLQHDPNPFATSATFEYRVWGFLPAV